LKGIVSKNNQTKSRSGDYRIAEAGKEKEGREASGDYLTTSGPFYQKVPRADIAGPLTDGKSILVNIQKS